MTLREQIMKELKEKDSNNKTAIKECEDRIDAEAFAISTITGGAFSGAARRACERRMEAARSEKNKLTKENSWISEMLDKYK